MATTTTKPGQPGGRSFSQSGVIMFLIAAGVLFIILFITMAGNFFEPDRPGTGGPNTDKSTDQRAVP